MVYSESLSQTILIKKVKNTFLPFNLLSLIFFLDPAATFCGVVQLKFLF